jgi:hypothetical protein
MNREPNTAIPDIDRPRAKHLTAYLPEANWKHWQPPLEPVEMPLGRMLYHSKGTLPYVYFPISAIASLLYVVENGALSLAHPRHNVLIPGAQGTFLQAPSDPAPRYSE